MVYMSGWNQKGRDIDGESENNYSGIGLNLSYDGKTVAVGRV